MSIPIIFTHTKNSLYLQLALLQAKKSCKENICLIGDSSNDASFVKHYNISDYDHSDLCLDFEKNYKHFSPNPYGYEFFCYKRWFVALDFLQKNNLSECFCADSDVLIYDDLNSLKVFFDNKNGSGRDFSVIRFTGEFAGPQCCYFTREALERYCNFILTMYRDEFPKLKTIYDGFKSKGYECGLSDMVLLAEFCKANPGKYMDFDYSTDRDFCFDENFGISYGFECGRKGKKLLMKNGIPFVKRLDSEKSVKFFMLHFQGDNKLFMNKNCPLSFFEKLESPYYLKLLVKTIVKVFCKKILSFAPKGFQSFVKNAVKGR
ncbi:MAG: hypothetical protein K5917_03035 [Clostridiales bacterium]|nr:hypothetical protein [Clostridiales bacterium]